MNRGEVVEVDWQYKDMSGSKLRPAVVVQADFLNGMIDDLSQLTQSDCHVITNRNSVALF